MVDGGWWFVGTYQPLTTNHQPAEMLHERAVASLWSLVFGLWSTTNEKTKD